MHIVRCTHICGCMVLLFRYHVFDALLTETGRRWNEYTRIESFSPGIMLGFSRRLLFCLHPNGSILACVPMLVNTFLDNR